MSRSKSHVPIRTCISCGTKNDKKHLNRLSLDARGLLTNDDKGKLPGRGAYVCDDKLCWEKLKKGNRLGKVFRRGSIDFHPDFIFG